MPVPHAFWSKSLIPTLKENPQEALIKSHRLMLRAGLIRKLASGTYSYLPLGLRALRKAEAIVREEMDRTGALELLLPALHPAELWKETGRYDILGEDMLRFKDRHGKDNVLGPTHEEIVTDLARRELRSYKQLPVTLYQIQTKFRDEMRPRSGIIRSREFLMKDAYSFHEDDASLEETYRAMKEAYTRLFKRCGLEFFIAQADPGAMGGSGSQEFVLFSDAGEDRMVRVGDSDVVMSVEMAARKIVGATLGSPLQGLSGKFKKVHTPGHSSVESVAQFLNKKPQSLIKTMIYQRSDGSFFEVLVRGDHEVSEYKIKKIEPGSFMASRQAIEKLGSAFGFSGPFCPDTESPQAEGRIKLKMYIDEDVLQMHDFVTGANRRDYHLTDMNLGDIKGSDFHIGDFRQVTEGDVSPEGKPLHFKTAIELGHIFKLNLRYSQPMKAVVLGADGREKPMVMGCYGIGVNRILAAAIEQASDERGIVWPRSISPYQVHIVLIDAQDAQSRQVVSQLIESKEVIDSKTDILIDDREGSAGVKFNDADLIGIPLRVILGPKNLKNGQAEIKHRKTGESFLVDLGDLPGQILHHLSKLA